MMKLVINIPCYNEEDTLPQVVSTLPDSIPGIQEIQVQIVDDGSTDQTKRIAEDLGCRVICHKSNLGLGRAFQTGVNAALENGCDIFVNLDADNQYPSGYIPNLVSSVLAGNADIVIGNRKPWNITHFSKFKRFLQLLGNGVFRYLLNVDVPDVISGFRAYSKEALLKIHVTTRYSYTLDTLVQAAKKGLMIRSIDIETNPPTRQSRLFKNIIQYVLISSVSFARILIIYEPVKTFLWGSSLLFLPGFLLIARYLYFFFGGDRAGHLQSIVAGALLIILSAIIFSLGIIAMLIDMNRIYHEQVLYLKKKELYGK